MHAVPERYGNMNASTVSSSLVKSTKVKKKLSLIWSYRIFYFMLIPGLVCLFLFHYLPMYGVGLAFREFSFTGGILSGEYVGMKYFEKALHDKFFISALINTVTISFSKLVFGFPVPIIFSLLLNELRSARMKKYFQAFSFLPYFVSWVVLSSIFITLFSMDGPINYIVRLFGGTPRVFLGESDSFVAIIIITSIWQTLGWNSVIYTAALSGVDPQLYEAAVLDGASKIKQIVHISLPAITSTIVIMLILNVGSILNAGFDQVFNMMNASVLDKAEIIDTYVYKKGMQEMNYSYATAIGLFKSVVGLVFVLVTNKIASVIGGKESTLF